MRLTSRRLISMAKRLVCVYQRLNSVEYWLQDHCSLTDGCLVIHGIWNRQGKLLGSLQRTKCRGKGICIFWRRIHLVLMELNYWSSANQINRCIKKHNWLIANFQRQSRWAINNFSCFIFISQLRISMIRILPWNWHDQFHIIIVIYTNQFRESQFWIKTFLKIIIWNS